MRIYEVESNTVFVMFAYSNPPTKEYKDYFEQLKSDAGDSEHIIYLNPVSSNELNPLGFKDLFDYNKRFFSGINFSRDKLHNAVDILRDLSKNYTNVVFYTTPENSDSKDKLEKYASSFGITSFSLRTIKSRFSGANEKARKAVIDNDFSLFLKQFSLSNKHILSELFITLRKVILLDSTDINKKPVSISENILSIIIDKNSTVQLLNEQFRYDRMNNPYLELDNILIVENKSLSKAATGKCRYTDKIVLFLPEITFQYIDKNRSFIDKLYETTVSGNIASLVQPIGIVNRRLDVTELDIELEGAADLVTALRLFINKHGYIDNRVISKLKEKYGKV